MTGRGTLGLLQRFGPVAVLLVLLLAALVSGLADHLSLEELRARGESLRELARQRPLFSLAVYVALYVVTVSISLPGALIMSLSGGFLFGPVLGGAAAVSGVTGGSTIVFLVSKSAFGTFMKAWENPLLLRVEEGFREDAFAYLLTLRLIPAFPLLLVNIAAGLMNVPLRTFLTASILGVLPSSMIYAGIGSGLGHVFAQSGPIALSSLLSPQIYLPVIGMGALAFLPPLWRHWRRGRVAPASDVK
jgi:uncharacterized membrane protein YdjX (TVP38/TMEM64 family)